MISIKKSKIFRFRQKKETFYLFFKYNIYNFGYDLQYKAYIYHETSNAISPEKLQYKALLCLELP